MATTLTLTVNASPSGDIAEQTSFSSGTMTLSQSADRVVTQEISHSSHSALTTTGITTPGYVVVKNLSASNWIEIGVEVSSTFYPLMRIKPLRVAAFELSPGVTMYAKATTGASILRYRVFSA